MTGHQVFATLHTNDSFGVIPRLQDLGVSTSMLAGNVIAVISQRLVRRLCPKCRESYTISTAEAELLHTTKGQKIFVAKGCTQCRNTGYKGRLALAEILMFESTLEDLIAKGATPSEMKLYAQSRGFRGITEDARQRVLEGHTSLHEVMRVTDLRAH